MYDNRVINNYYLVPTHNLDVGCISPKSKNPYPLFVLKAMNADKIDQKTARRFFHLVGLTFKSLRCWETIHIKNTPDPNQI